MDNSVRPTTKHPTQDKKRTIFAFRSKFELYGIKIPYFCVSSLANFFVLTYVDKALAAIKRTLSREKLGVFVIRDVALGLKGELFFKPTANLGSVYLYSIHKAICRPSEIRTQNGRIS